jgi:quercetin dioxygenase-like cupin family protein
MSTAIPIIRQDGEGELMWFAGGGAFTWKATSAETGGAFILLEDRMVRGKSTPFHLHPNEDEAIYVLEGELLVHIDGEEHRVGPGGLFFAPRGVPHAFMVTSETAHVLGWQTPGTGESFYRDAGGRAIPEHRAARTPAVRRRAARGRPRPVLKRQTRDGRSSTTLRPDGSQTPRPTAGQVSRVLVSH